MKKKGLFDINNRIEYNCVFMIISLVWTISLSFLGSCFVYDIGKERKWKEERKPDLKYIK